MAPQIALTKNAAPNLGHTASANAVASETAPIANANKYIQRLLEIQSGAREASSLPELQYLIANESLKLLEVDQIVVFRGAPDNAGWRIEKISSVTEVDRDAPLSKWLLSQVTPALLKDTSRSHCDIELKRRGEGKNYPFSHCHALNITNRSGEVLGVVCLMSEEPMGAGARELAEHLRNTFNHAWSALQPKKDIFSRLLTKRNALLASVAVVLLMCLPVRMTVLAPVEIVADNPTIVAAPLAGVIERVVVAPNSFVEEGSVLFEFNTLESANNLAILDKELSVSKARFERATQSAFDNGDGRRELLVTSAEYKVAQAKLEYAQQQLNTTEVRATSAGVAVFSSKNDWEGRPVSVGERVMRIADPSKVKAKLEVGLSDAAILEQDLTAKLFLDARPLSPVDVTISSTGFVAEKMPAGHLAFPVEAELVEDDEALRIGWRGTAQLKGERVLLAYNLFRKPISSIRQYLGW